MMTRRAIQTIGAIALLACLLMLPSGCAYTAQTIELEIKKPARITLPRYVRKLTLLNHTVNQPLAAGHELVVPPSWGEYQNRRFTFKTDTLPSLYLSTTSRILTQTGFFMQVDCLPQSERTSGSFLTAEPPTAQRLKEIANRNDADLILTLERMPVRSSLTLEPFLDGTFVRALLTIIAQPEVSLYFPREERYGTTIVGRDTLVLERVATDAEMALAYFPTSSEIDQVLTEMMSDRLVRQLIPSSRSEERVIYSSTDPNMQDALRYTQHSKWQEAYWIWEYLAQKNKNKVQRSDILTNMALYFELNDTFAEAIRLATEALSLLPESGSERREYLSRYLQILQERKEEKKQLNEQLGD